MPNKPTKIASEYNAYVPDPEVIKEFFSCCGDASGINETLWDMFSESISSPDSGTEYRENAHRAFLYKRLTELMIALEPPAKFGKADLNEN